MTGGMLPQQPDCAGVHRALPRARQAGRRRRARCDLEPASLPDGRFPGSRRGRRRHRRLCRRLGGRAARRRVPGGEVQDRRNAQTPIPRFDLLKLDHYLYVGVQYSRGCPFTCEFCDIIELYGRVPRAKTTPQMLAELETLYRARLSRPCRLRRRQPDRQQEGAEVVPAASCGSWPKRTTIRSNSRPRLRSISPTTTNCWR